MLTPLLQAQDLRLSSLPPAGLYVHIPFCRTKCVYCDFNCYAGQSRLIPQYVDALLTELRAYARLGLKAKTLYLGGGTPSLLTVDQVGRIRRCGEDELGLSSGEVTLEANPGTVTEEYFRGLRSVGVNRLSIGVQSFRDEDLRRLARHHSAADAEAAYAAARRAGFENISLDLIYGLPWQTVADWERNLLRALELHPEHVSLYALTVEEGTPLARLVERGRVPAPDDDLMADMYLLAHQMLESGGLGRYEISNWAIAGRESRHNLVYWQDEPFVGVGAGAHGYLARHRYSNELVPAGYIEVVGTGELSIAQSEPVHPALERAEAVMLGLRLDAGLSCRAYEARFGEPLGERFGPQLREAEGYGLLTWELDTLRLTDRGRLLSNELFQNLLPGDALTPG